MAERNYCSGKAREEGGAQWRVRRVGAPRTLLDTAQATSCAQETTPPRSHQSVVACETPVQLFHIRQTTGSCTNGTRQLSPRGASARYVLVDSTMHLERIKYPAAA